MATNRRRVEQKYELFDDGEIKLDYKNILNVSSTETTDDVDEISNDVRHDENTVKFNDVRHTTTDKIWDTTTTMMMGDGSFEKERAEMTETFENEKSDIVKGFILEKRILSREHKQEKQDLISNFVKERQNMLDHFQKQVKDIEQKMTHTESKTTFAENSVNSEKAFNLTNESRRKYEAHSSPKKSMPGKLMIKVEGDRILTPDQFLSAMELEERFESEKEVIEKSFRKEKHNLKDKLEVEYSRKLLHEKEKHDREILTLRQEIDKLRNLKHEVADVWKTQASQLESEFFKERSALERHHSEEKDTLRRRLEERNQSKLRSQQEDYDRMIRDLRNELRQIKKEVTRNDEHVAQKPCDIRKEIESRLQAHYDNETRQLRQQNEKLNSEIKNLTTEKYDLSRKLRDIENDKSNESKFLKQHSEKQNKEYIEKMKRIMSQNEKLKSQISQIEKHKEDLKALIKNQENNNRNIEGRLEMSERTIVQYEDTVTGLRRENSNLSHEINLLRIEKEELSSMISQHNEQDRSIKIDAQRMQHNVEESRKKIVLLEREKLKFEKALEITRMELEKSKNDIKKTATKIEAYTKESDRLRSLLDSERSESKRLHERFKTDAELLRKKENENATTRTQLDNIKTQFETLKTRIEADNDKFFKIEKERQSLQKQLEKRKSSEAIQTKHELLKIQNSYCKEFSKRLEYVKANYEREIFNLKEKLGELMTNGAEIKFTPQPPQHCQRCPEHSSSPNRRAREVPVFQSNLPPNPSFLYNNNGNILDCSTKCSAMKQDHVSNHQDNFEHTNSLLNSSKQILEVSSEQLIRDRLSKGRQNPTNSSFRQVCKYF